MKTLCIDSNSIVNRAYYGIKPLSTKDGIFTNGIYGFLNILFKLKDEVNPDKIICAFDLREPTFRHKEYSEYKAGRHAMPEELAMQIPILKELISALGFEVVSLAGYEADDLLGTFSKLTEESGGECFIATGDKDYLQLISPKTKLFLFTTSKGSPLTTLCGEEYVKEKYGVTPREMLEVKALMGDSSDNIPGVRGIGEKTALSLIGKYHSIDNIYNSLEEIEATKSVKAKLEQGKDSAYLSRFLGEICRSVPIEKPLDQIAIREMDREEAFRLLSKLEMTSFLKKLGLDSMVLEIETPKEQEKTKIVVGKLPKLEESDLVSLFAKFEKEKLSSFALVKENKLYYFDNEVDGIENSFRELISSKARKKTFDCKKIFYYCYDKGIEPMAEGELNYDFDMVLSAYLLDANAKSYDEESLLSLYSIGIADELNYDDGEAPLSKEREENCKELLRLVSLEKELEKEAQSKNQLELLRTIEIPLANVLASMEHTGFYVDKNELKVFGESLATQIDSLKNRIYDLAGEEFNINSPKQLGEILFVKLGLPPKKKTKTGFSTNSSVLEELAGESEIVELVLKYRQLAKLSSTYVEGLSKEIKADGKIHSHFNQTETRTGRISSAEPNLQNIPVRTELGREIRKFFKADEGCVLVDADYSQIELRVLAHISGDETMLSAFRNNEDIHTKTASEVFGLPKEFVTPELRSRAKAVNFGIVYGIGAFSLSKDIGTSVREADSYIKSYLARFPAVKRYMDSTIQEAKETGFVTTLYGRKREIPEISSSNHNLRAFGERVALNTPIQGTAADIIKIAMIKVFSRLKKEKMKSKLILQIHDELIVLAPLEEAQRASELLREEMENAVELKLKLVADTKIGSSWFETK